jgi:hypothetical protein
MLRPEKPIEVRQRYGTVSMPRNWTHTQAFAYFGTKPKNVQWSWSARNATTKIVVVTLWQDLFKDRGVYDWPAGVGQASLGFAELMDNLTWAQTQAADFT